jgi:hypothetical protein
MKLKTGGIDRDGIKSVVALANVFTNSLSSDNSSPTIVAAIGFAMISWKNFKGGSKTK